MLKKVLSVTLAILIMMLSVPMTSLAADEDGCTLTIAADATGATSDVAFTYEVMLDGALADATALGDDGVAYEVVDGMVTIPAEVTATISGIEAGATYSVTRMEYDNAEYALVSASAAQTGVLGGSEYSVVKNGETTLITADEYNEATNDGETETVIDIYDAEGTSYDTYYTTSEGATVAEYETIDYVVSTSYTGSSKNVSTTVFGYTTTVTYYGYSCPTSLTATIDGVAFSEALTASCTAGDVKAYLTEDLAKTAALVEVNTDVSEVVEAFESALSATGKSYNLISEPSTTMTSTSDFGTATYQAELYATEVTVDTYEYAAEIKEGSADLTFAVALEAAPTATIVVNYNLDSLTSSQEGVFEIATLDGTVLVEGEDYTLTKEDTTVAALLDSISTSISDYITLDIGYTAYTFSDIATGDYTFTQVGGPNGYTIDATAYAFSVARDGTISSTEEKSAVESGALNFYTSVTSIALSDYDLLGWFGWEDLNLYFFSNASFDIEFTKVDQDGVALAGAEFVMVERAALVTMITEIADFGVESFETMFNNISDMDFSSLTDLVSSDEEFSLDVDTIVALLTSLTELTGAQLETLTIPAIHMATSGDDGVVAFSNSTNILSIADYVNLDTFTLADLGDLFASLLGDTLDEEMLEYLDVLDAFDTVISVRTGMPTGAYVMMESTAPTGYEGTELFYTITVNADTTATIEVGFIVSAAIELFTEQLDIDLAGVILETEEEFLAMYDELMDEYATYDEYVAEVADQIVAYANEYIGEYVDLTELEELAATIVEYAQTPYTLTESIEAALEEFNAYFTAEAMTADYNVYNEIIYVDVTLESVLCDGTAIDGATYTVTDAEGNEVALNDDATSFTAIYGTYTVAVTVDEKYVATEDTTFEVVIESEDDFTQTFAYHSLIVTTTPATCVEDGSIVTSCEVCGEVFETVVLEATGIHTYEAVETPATATEDGYTTYTCTVCGDSYVVVDEGSAAAVTADLLAQAKLAVEAYDFTALVSTTADEANTAIGWQMILGASKEFTYGINYKTTAVEFVASTDDTLGYYTFCAELLYNGQTVTTEQITVAVEATQGYAAVEVTDSYTNTPDAVRINWVANSNAAGYELYQLVEDEYVLIATIEDGSADTYRIDDLEVASTFTFKVKAYYYDINGEVAYGELSDTMTAKTELVYDQLQMLETYSNTNTAVRINWESQEDALGYRVFMMIDGEWESIATVYGEETTTYRVADLVVNSSYTFYVVAYYENVDGVFEWGTASEEFVAMTETAQVQMLDNYSNVYDAVRINWETVDDAAGYRVYMLIDGTYTKIATLYGEDVDTYRIAGLEEGTTYSFKVKAFFKETDDSVATWALASEAFEAATESSTVVVTGFTSTTSSITLEWDKVYLASGYRVYMYVDGSWVKVKTLYGTSTTDYTVEGLDVGTVYEFKVKAFFKETDDSVATWALASEAFTAMTAPSTVSITSYSNTEDAIRINWTESTGATGYKIYELVDGQWVVVDTIYDASVTTLRISGLEEATSYSYKVRPFSKTIGSVVWGSSDGGTVTETE
ncbi:MAG: fibronectin type III domain-containing protein [Clostridia bacterium]